MKPIVLWSDALIFLLVIALVAFFYRLRRDPQTRERWGEVFSSRLGMVTFTIILTYVGVALLDSLHFRRALDNPGGMQNSQVFYDNKVTSVLDVLLGGMGDRFERTYSAPFALKSSEKKNMKDASGNMVRDYPQLEHAGRHLEPFSHQLEVVDQRLHAHVQLISRRKADLAVLALVGAIRQILYRLADDAQALAHLFHSNQVTAIRVAAVAHRHLEVVVLIATIRHVTAQIPIDAAAAQHGAGHAHVDGFRPAQHADTFQAFTPERPLCQHLFVLIDVARHHFEELAQAFQKGGRQVLPDAADADITEREPGATDHLKEIEDPLPFTGGVHEQAHARPRHVQDVG